MSGSATDIWTRTSKELRKDLNLLTFESWIEPIRAKGFEGTHLTLEVSNSFIKEWIEKHYLERIEGAVHKVSDPELRVRLRVNPGSQGTASPKAAPPPRPMIRRILPTAEMNINPNYTFEKFVVGPSNQLAFAASVAVAQAPGQAYNPLFLYGSVGLGKTHLMQAIGHYIHTRRNRTRVLYISSEEFTNQLISAIQNRNTPRFRNRYRNMDILLIDDVHFLGGKEQTQEEFFHTFNTLYDAHKQIVLSSDRPPHEIKNLEKRLMSRFESGLICDLQIPEEETRIAILRKKAETMQIDLPDEAIRFIALHIRSNVRKLEGALIRFHSYVRLMSINPTVEAAREILKEAIESESRPLLTVAAIQRCVADYFDIRVSELLSRVRSREVSRPRQIAMYLTRKLTASSLPEIGEAFGGRDHSTVLHACKTVEAAARKNYKTRTTLKAVRQRLGQ